MKALRSYFGSSFLKLRPMMRYAEWILLLMYGLAYGIDWYFYKLPTLPDLFSRVLVFITVFWLLSCFFPIKQPHWVRYTYIGLEISLVLGAQLLLVDLHLLLYLILIKSCFLFNRKAIVYLVTGSGISYLLCVWWTIPIIEKLFIETARSQQWEEIYKPQAIILSSSVEYISISALVMVIGFLIMAERRSRQRSEALAQAMETLAADLERSRIAREIHDSLGHALTTLRLQLELVQVMQGRDRDQAATALNHAQTLASQCLEAVHQAVQTTRDPSFQLDGALQRLINQIHNTQSLVITSRLNLPAIDIQTSHQVYCIIQEALTNVQKHARASRVDLLGNYTASTLTLDITDNGQGFDLGAATTGYGLRGMRERVQLLGGQFAIASAPGKGTTLRITIPRSLGLTPED
ncbi:sensor histidine kinase [Limnothrix redekei]|uniref:Oxygen sensor histidine kinase NreB n=1 Tax=Limnothrix redekei LRLZ20PSL1 TaxID=3112953 RepID=A0ABW7C843_9CYAN